MRELKFDFIHNNAGKEYVGNMWHYIKKSNDGLLTSDVGIIRIFTGFKDCKETELYPTGQDVFEGDILELHYEFYGTLQNYIVKFGVYTPFDCDDNGEGNGFYLELIEDDRNGIDVISFSTPSIQTFKYEMIGNIYQNPELLK